MTLTKHAKDRLAERFGIRSDSERLKAIRKFERDFISFETEAEGKVSKTIIWKEAYLKGVFNEEGVLITVIHKGWTMYHYLHKKNPALRQGKQRYRNRNRRQRNETISRRNPGNRRKERVHSF